LQYINIYYSDEALSNNGFSYKGGKLTLGNTPIRICQEIKREKVETFLMIGDTKDKKKMNKLTTDTDNELNTNNKIEKQNRPVPLNQSKLNELIKSANLPQEAIDVFQKEITFDEKGQLLAPDGLKNFVNGTIKITKYK